MSEKEVKQALNISRRDVTEGEGEKRVNQQNTHTSSEENEKLKYLNVTSAHARGRAKSETRCANARGKMYGCADVETC